MAALGRGVKDRGIEKGHEAGSKNVSGAPAFKKVGGNANGTKGSGPKNEPAYKPKGPRKIGRPS